MLSMSDLFSYLLPYPAVLQFCDSKLQPLTNLPSKLVITVLLVDSGRSSLVTKQREYQINPTFSWMLPRLSYGFYSNCYFNWHGKEEIKIWCQYISTGIELRNQFNWQHLLGIKFPNLLGCIFAYQFEYFNWCEIFVIASFIVQLELLFELCLSGGFTIACMSNFLLIYIGHKSSKASIRPKSFNYTISYPTTNPTYPPWLIAKFSRFIRSTSCGYEPKLTLTSSSKQS